LKIIITGAGEVGYHIAGRLAAENKDVVVIDRNPSSVKRITDNIDVEAICASGNSPKVLEAAGIRQADILLAVTDSDETNLVTCLMADIISPSTRKLARIRESDYDAYHDFFRKQSPHIDTIINPEIEVVKSIEQLLSVPGAADVSSFADGKLKFAGFYLHAGNPLIGIRLADLPGKMGGHVLVAAIIRDQELIIPEGAHKLNSGDLVYFISEEKNFSPIIAAFKKEAKPVKTAMIIGGGRIGTRLAAVLEDKSIYTKIIERSVPRAKELSDILQKAVVICGDGSDHRLLLEENIREMDAVITATNDEETNILVSLMARRMGVQKAITRLDKFSYFSLMPAIGIEQVVSPRMSAVNTILQHIRKGKVLSVRTLTGEQGEIIEAEALETSDIVGKPLRKNFFPKGSLVIGIIRKDEVIIPSGASVIEPGDRVIIFAKRQVVEKIEKILTVKLEFF
jgi:trk system potassium uptake protein